MTYQLGKARKKSGALHHRCSHSSSDSRSDHVADSPSSGDASGTSLGLRDTGQQKCQATLVHGESRLGTMSALDDNSTRQSLMFREPGTIKRLLPITVTLVRPLYTGFSPALSHRPTLPRFCFLEPPSK